MALPQYIVENIENTLQREKESVQYAIENDMLKVTVHDVCEFALKLNLTFEDVEHLGEDGDARSIIENFSDNPSAVYGLSVAQLRMVFEDYSEAVQRRQGAELGK